MITVANIITAIQDGDIPVSMAVELNSSWYKILTNEGSAADMLELLELQDILPTVENAIEAAEKTESYLNLTPSLRWSEEAADVASGEKRSLRDLLKIRGEVRERMRQSGSASVLSAWEAIYRTLSAVSCREEKRAHAQWAIIYADQAFKYYVKEEKKKLPGHRQLTAHRRSHLQSVIPNLIRSRFEQPTIQQLVAAARARR